jgi:cytoskeleton-associated protein 5
VRNEALQKLASIVTENKLVTNNLGELPNVLAHRLIDSNSKIAAAAIAICQSLANAMGMQTKLHVRTLFPGMLQGMGDSKVRHFILNHIYVNIRYPHLQCLVFRNVYV